MPASHALHAPAAKVDEHEETQREQQLLNNMAGGAPQVPQQQQQLGGAVKAAVAAEKDKDAQGPRGLPALTPSNLLAMAAGAKDAVMGSLCRMFRFKH